MDRSPNEVVLPNNEDLKLSRIGEEVRRVRQDDSRAHRIASQAT